MALLHFRVQLLQFRDVSFDQSIELMRRLLVFGLFVNLHQLFAAHQVPMKGFGRKDC